MTSRNSVNNLLTLCYDIKRPSMFIIKGDSILTHLVLVCAYINY